MGMRSTHAPAGASERAVIDEERLGHLAEDFPPQVLREVVGAFLQSAPVTVERLVLAAEGEDHEEVAQGAHKLKGSCLVVGAHALNEAARALERLGAERAPVEGLRDGAARVEAAWLATRAALRARVGRRA